MNQIIKKVTIYHTQLGGRHPVFVKIDTNEGISGMGEAGIAYGVGAASVCVMIKELSDKYLLGKDASEIEAFLARIYDLAFWAKGGGAIIYSAISAIEQALWDIQGKTLNVPVFQLFGGKLRDKIQVYSNGWTLNANSPDEYALQAEMAVRDGHRALKMYPFTTPVGDKKLNLFDIPQLRTASRELEKLAVERVKAVRKAVGPDIELMIDLSTVLTPDAVIHFGKQIEDLDIFWIEEAAEPSNISGLRQISMHLSIPLATGERLYSRYGFKDTILSDCINFIQPDLGNCGGFLEAKKISAFAEPFGIRIAFHNCASPYLTAVSAHLAACIPNFAFLECFNYLIPEHYSILKGTSLEDTFIDGCLFINDRPGFGFEVDTHWLNKFQVV
jgi:galactonate dehydratase